MDALRQNPPSLAAAEDVLDALREFARDRAHPAGCIELERRFLHMEKLLTLGQVTLEVVHDFGNLMTIVLGYGDLLLTTLDMKGSCRGYLFFPRSAEFQAG